MTIEKTVIAIVDDDEAVRLSTCALLKQGGYGVRAFTSGDHFLATPMSEPTSCILLDLVLPGLDGPAVLHALRERSDPPPVIVISPHGDLASAVEAMKLGAYDFIQKPYAPEVLMSAIQTAVVSGHQMQDVRTSHARAAALVESLTPRQRNVLEGILRGQQSKIIAYELKLSIRTIEAYRGLLMSKLGVHSIAGAVRIALAAGMLLGGDFTPL